MAEQLDRLETSLSDRYAIRGTRIGAVVAGEGVWLDGSLVAANGFQHF